MSEYMQNDSLEIAIAFFVAIIVFVVYINSMYHTDVCINGYSDGYYTHNFDDLRKYNIIESHGNYFSLNSTERHNIEYASGYIMGYNDYVSGKEYDCPSKWYNI